MKRSSLNARGNPYNFHTYRKPMYNSNVNNRYSFPKYKSYRFSLDNNMPSSEKDFIPLNQSLPIMQHEHDSVPSDHSVHSDQSVHRHHSANWRGNADINPRRWHNNRPNYNNCKYPQSNYQKQYSEYNYGNNGKKFYGNRMNKRDVHRPINIHAYIDLSSILEDPWADLEKKLNDSKNKINEGTPKNESSFATLTDNCESQESESKLSNSDIDVNS